MKTVKIKKRQTRVRAKVKGVLNKPRLSVFRSNKHIYAQVIDDQKRATLVGAGKKDCLLKRNLTKPKEQET